jgi:hypothetical protein
VPVDEAEVLLADSGRWQRLLSGGDFVIVNPEYDQPEYQVH